MSTTISDKLEREDTTYDEHMRWCKQRALAYLPHNPVDAIASMLSDLTKHPQTASLVKTFGMIGLVSTDHPDQARRFIEGFN